MKRVWLKILLAVVLSFTLGISTASADELWVRNTGGLEVTVWSESDWQDVTATTDSGIIAVGPCSPGEEPESGKAKVASATLTDEWVVIEADNIDSYRIDVACNQMGEDVAPEVLQVIEYEGTRISFDPTTTTKEDVLAALESVGPPPPPPDATNTDVWVDPFGDSPADNPPVDDDGGQSIADMNAAADDWVHDWSGQEVWLYT